MKRILVLGATSHIAQQVIRIWAERGEALYLVGRNAERLETVAADARVRGAARVETRPADLRAPENPANLVREAATTLGALDIALVAHWELGGEKSQRCPEEATRLLAVNFVGAVALLTELGNYFEGQGKGVIAALGSVAGERGRQSNYVYGAAKGGLAVFLSGLRNRLHPHGVTVLTVKLGPVDTPMTRDMPRGLLMARSTPVARRIVTAIDRRADQVYVPGYWRYVMAGIRAIPERFFKTLRL